jgi:hypothetical protein
MPCGDEGASSTETETETETETAAPPTAAQLDAGTMASVGAPAEPSSPAVLATSGNDVLQPQLGRTNRAAEPEVAAGSAAASDTAQQPPPPLEPAKTEPGMRVRLLSDSVVTGTVVKRVNANMRVQFDADGTAKWMPCALWTGCANA